MQSCIFDRLVACAAQLILLAYVSGHFQMYTQQWTGQQSFACQTTSKKDASLLAIAQSGRLWTYQRYSNYLTYARFFQHLTGRTYESRLRWAHSPGICCCCEMAISICLSHTMLASTRGSMVCARDFAQALPHAASAVLTRARHDGIVTLAWIGMDFNVTCAIHEHCVQYLRPCIAAYHCLRWIVISMDSIRVRYSHRGRIQHTRVGRASSSSTTIKAERGCQDVRFLQPRLKNLYV